MTLHVKYHLQIALTCGYVAVISEWHCSCYSDCSRALFLAIVAVISGWHWPWHLLHWFRPSSPYVRVPSHGTCTCKPLFLPSNTLALQWKMQYYCHIRGTIWCHITYSRRKLHIAYLCRSVINIWQNEVSYAVQYNWLKSIFMLTAANLTWQVTTIYGMSVTPLTFITSCVQCI